MAACNSSSRGSGALFWLSWALHPGHTHLKEQTQSYKMLDCSRVVYICILFKMNGWVSGWMDDILGVRRLGEKKKE